MHTSLRRTFFNLFLTFCFLAAGTSLMAYPVSIAINVTFSDLPGQQDPLGLGTASPNTATITSVIESAAAAPGATTATYPATVFVTVPALASLGFTNAQESGTLTINTDGTITASFTQTNSHGAAVATLSAVVVTGLTLPAPEPLSFGTANFSAPASTSSYSVLGAVGTVGITGTISAVGLVASPITPIVATYSGGTAPAPQQIAVSSNDPANPALGFSATIAPGSNNSSTNFLTLSESSSTVPGTVTANFSTAVAAGTYTANILINTTADATGAPFTIPVTYTVTTGNGPQLQVSSPSLSYTFTSGGSTSGSKSVSVTSTGGTLNYSAVVTSGSSFLSVSPTAGSTPGSFSAMVNASALSAGTYSGSIQLTASGVPTVTIPVSVLVNPVVGTGITAAPTSLSFSYVPGQPIPPSQTIQISSATPVKFTVNNVALYLPVTPVEDTTNATLTVTLNPAGLSTGTYFNNLQVTSSSGTLSIPISVTIGPSAVIGLSQFTLGFTYPAAPDTPLTQTVNVSGSSAVAISATTESPWLSVTQSSSTTPSTLSITANPTGQTAGTLTGTVVVASLDAQNSPQTIHVTFQVNQAGAPVLSAAPTAVAFAYQSGGIVPASQTIQLSSNPAGAAYTVSGFGASWLTVTPSADLTSARLSVNPAGLNAGVYTGSVKIDGAGISNAPLFIPVTLTVAPNPTLGTSPTSLTFSAQPGVSGSISQVLAIGSSFASGVSATVDASWLTVTLAGSTAPTTATVTANPGTMAAGSYSGHVTITGTGANPPTVIVPVSLMISANAAPVLSAVTNGISYANQIGAPGLIVALWGTGLGPATPAGLTLSNPTTIGTTTGGTTVLADGIPCPILFSSAQQVNAILPFSIAGEASTQIQVQYQGVTSNPITIPVQTSAPAIFSENATGSGAGAILNQDLSLNTAAHPAAQGSIVVIYAGGGGQTNPGGADGLIVPAVNPIPAPVNTPTLTIGGQPAKLLYAGDAPDLVSGVLQFNAKLPAGLASGPQPVVLTIDGFSSQPNLFVYVQ